MKKHVLLILAIVLLINFYEYQAYPFKRCRYYISSGQQELSGFKIARDICSNTSEIVCPLESNGSLENIYNLLNNKLVIAGLVQSDIVIAAARKKNEKVNNLKIVMPIKREMVHVIVKKNSKITNFKDLTNTVICTGKRTSGSYYTSLQIKAMSNSTWIEAEEDFNTCMKLLNRQSVDAVFTLSSPPVSCLQKKIGKEYRLIKIPPIKGYRSILLNEYKNSPAITTVYVDTLLLVVENKMKQNNRIANKLSLGISAVIEKLPPLLKNDICTNKFNSFKLGLSFLNREACKLGYFGKDW